MLVCRGVGGKENYQKKVFLEWEKKKVANVWVVEYVDVVSELLGTSPLTYCCL